MFLIQDGQGKVFNRVQKPTAVYDAKDSVLLKIGEWEKMYEYYEDVQKRYQSFDLSEVAKDIRIMELPKDQEVIDKVFQICDYIGVLHRNVLKTCQVTT